MGKTIGKRLVFLFICVAQIISANISMRVLDLQGKPLSKVAAGKPFKLEVQVSSTSQFGTHPIIRGFDELVHKGVAHIQKTGTQVNAINNRAVGIYSYYVVISEPNTYTLGPAILSTGNNQFNSNVIQLEVADREEIVLENQAPEKKLFMRLMLDKETVFVGERIPCRLRFYFTDARIALSQLLLKENKVFEKKKWQGAYTGTEFIDGIEYNYAEWSWDLYAHSAGTHSIPAYGAEYESSCEPDDFVGGFRRLFFRPEIKRVYSNEASVRVRPLPAHDKDINGIGSFSYIHISVQPSVVKQGEGIVLTIEIAGDADMDKVMFNGLEGIPDSLKYYDSKQTVIEPQETGDVYKKRFEFVVQGLKTGSWDIPEQTFHYFDIEKHMYRTLKTAPLTLTVLPGAKTNTAPPSMDTKKVDQAPIASLHEDGPWVPVSKGWACAWWVIGLLLMMPLIIVVLYHIWIRYKNRVRVPYATLRSRYAFKQAQKRFKKICEKQDVRALYALFVELIAARSKTSFGAITAPFIMMQLQKKNFSPDEIEQWDQFFAAITERAYGAHADKTDEQLLREAELWLTKLQNIL